MYMQCTLSPLILHIGSGRKIHLIVEIPGCRFVFFLCKSKHNCVSRVFIILIILWENNNNMSHAKFSRD